MNHDLSNVDERKEAFTRSIRRYGLVSLAIFALSGIAGLAIMSSLIPYRDHIDAFFDQRIGGNLGAGLKGLSYAAIGSTPIVIAMFWQIRRSRNSELCCSVCNSSFATVSRAETVVRENRCPVCGTIIFE